MKRKEAADEKALQALPHIDADEPEFEEEVFDDLDSLNDN